MTEELDFLAVEIIKTMKDQNAKETPHLKTGKLILTERAKWTYSKAVDAAAENLKSLQSLEQADGTATKNGGTEYLKYVQDR